MLKYIGYLNNLNGKPSNYAPGNQEDFTSTNCCPATEPKTSESELRFECPWSVQIPR